MLQSKSAFHLFALLFLVLSIVTHIISTPVTLNARDDYSDLSNVPGILVTSPESGHSYQFGDKIEITIYPHSSVKSIPEVNLYMGVKKVHVFEKNVTLTPPGQEYYVLKYDLPKKEGTNLTDDARYHVGFFNLSGQFISASATFKIGNPKFGLTFSSPPVKQSYHPGSVIPLVWSDDYDVYTKIKGAIYLLYYNENEVAPPLELFVNYEIVKGVANVTVPNLLIHRDCAIVIGLNRTSDIEGTVDGKPKEVTEYYIANPFNIV